MVMEQFVNAGMAITFPTIHQPTWRTKEQYLLEFLEFRCPSSTVSGHSPPIVRDYAPKQGVGFFDALMPLPSRH